MKQRKYDYYVADFETSVFPGQTSTEVWAAALVPLWSEDVKIDNNIDDFLKYIVHLKGNQIVYFHNLKFDGSFLLDFFLRVKQYKQARTEGKNITDFHFVDDKDMKNGEFKYVISNMGQWYSVTLKIKNKFIEFRDSLKLLPFSVEQIGKGFKTKHRKSSIEYIGERHAGGVIKEHEKVYIANDVLVVKEGLEILFSDGHNKMTIGACCLSEFKSTFFEKEDYDRLFQT